MCHLGSLLSAPSYSTVLNVFKRLRQGLTRATKVKDLALRWEIQLAAALVLQVKA